MHRQQLMTNTFTFCSDFYEPMDSAFAAKTQCSELKKKKMFSADSC